MRYAIRITLCALVYVCVACEREPSGSAAGGAAPTAPSIRGAGEVVIYSSIDEPYLRPIMQRFERESGIKTRIVTDTEATKSAGLAQRIIAEKNRPQADVYWGNEIFHTINMAGEGVFAPYAPSTAGDIPAKWRGKDDLYTCIALRARVIGVSTRLESKHLYPKIRGLDDLTDPALKGKIAMANPAFGTTSGHVAAMYVLWGEQKFTNYMTALKANEIKLLGGNSEVARQVGAGNLIAGLTDNDDVANVKANGGAINAVLPDQDSAGGAGAGTLMIPGTVALVAGAPHSDNAKKLIDFICSPAVEKELIERSFAAYSVRDTSVRGMDVDYVKVAQEMKRAIELALTILQDRGPRGP